VEAALLQLLPSAALLLNDLALLPTGPAGELVLLVLLVLLLLLVVLQTVAVESWVTGQQ
jgi:hypothetical protein